MESNVFKRHLITKLAVAGGFLLLTIAAVISITIVNAKVIAPNEGFITAALCKVETGNGQDSSSS